MNREGRRTDELRENEEKKGRKKNILSEREKERERRHTANMILSGTPIITTFTLFPLIENVILLFFFSPLRRSASILNSSPIFSWVLVA